MGTKTCMNTSCGATVSSTWKKGWLLKSGQTADLCFNCGSAYEKLAYCDSFHAEETGWRECSLCNKRLHCGCSASMPFIEIQDFGGVWCSSCAHRAGHNPTQRDGLPSEAPPKSTHAPVELQNPQPSNELDHHSLKDKRLLSLGIPSDGVFFELRMGIKSPIDFACKGLTNLSQPPTGARNFAKSCDDRPNSVVRNVQEPQLLPSMNISLGTSSDSTRFGLALPGGVEEGEKSRLSLIQPMQRPRHILPKPTRINSPKSSVADKGLAPPRRIARPPSEARLRSQLLPRYWPRITDQELQKLSGDLNSTIVPLFEKVLSASDASRIGRLVLPKACAEAYFPPINQSEGLPLKVMDVKGNEWTFQFRFWPNNNSRMYVLEGVTPCIQSMQLEAGDTVTFGRIDPGGKLVMGARKASNSFETQDQQTSQSGVLSEDNFCSDKSENRPTVNGSLGHQSMKGCKEDSLSYASERSKIPNGDTKLSKSEQFKGKTTVGLLQQTTVSPDKKKARNIGSKSKRLLMHSEDALELRITWEETQDLLRPPPGIQPTVVVIEDFEFEEFEEPPVFGKRTMFTAELSGSSCSAPEEISSKEWSQVHKAGRDSKKRKVTERADQGQGCKPSGLDALANAAVLGDHAPDSAEPSSGATTRHPRHRPGCSCIVCIQPPSGKGKHKSSCGCNVCLTVKRRFKTLMLRKKKRQNDREAEMARQPNVYNRNQPEEPELNGQAPPLKPDESDLEKEGKPNVVEEESESSGKEAIDLNCRPTREKEMRAEAPLKMYDNQASSSNRNPEPMTEPGSEPMAEPGSEPNDEPVRGSGSDDAVSGAAADGRGEGHGGQNSEAVAII